MAAHTLRGSWTLGAVACCSAAGAGPAEEEESWKQTRGDSSELTGGSCPREEKGEARLESRDTWSLLSGLIFQPSKLSSSTCLGCLLITFSPQPTGGAWCHGHLSQSSWQAPPRNGSESHLLGLGRGWSASHCV